MPALTKSNIIDAVTEANGFERKKATETVGALIEIIKRNLESGEDILASSFGKFRVRDKNERRGRNPATGKPMTLKKRRVVTFKCSKKLKDIVNG